MYITVRIGITLHLSFQMSTRRRSSPLPTLSIWTSRSKVSGFPFLPLILLTHLTALLTWDCFLEAEGCKQDVIKQVPVIEDRLMLTFPLREAGTGEVRLETELTPLWLSCNVHLSLGRAQLVIDQIG